MLGGSNVAVIGQSALFKQTKLDPDFCGGNFISSGSLWAMLAAIRLVAAMSLLRADERQHRMDKKNDDACKHRQRHSFVDGRTANHCNAFHSFPHPDGCEFPTCCCHAALLW